MDIVAEDITEAQKAARKASRVKYAATEKGRQTLARQKKTPKALANRRRRALKQFYGISPDEFEALFVAQGGHCALCPRTAADQAGRGLHVDHCHVTGRVRGLLCSSCNRGLGHLGDDEAGLLRALAYVRGLRWPA